MNSIIYPCFIIFQYISSSQLTSNYNLLTYLKDLPLFWYYRLCYLDDDEETRYKKHLCSLRMFQDFNCVLEMNSRLFSNQADIVTSRCIRCICQCPVITSFYICEFFPQKDITYLVRRHNQPKLYWITCTVESIHDYSHQACQHQNNAQTWEIQPQSSEI